MSGTSDQSKPGLSVARLLTRIQPSSVLSIISSLHEGLLALDTDLCIISMNPAAELILGREQSDLVGLSVCELFGDSACPQDVLAETLRSGEPVFDFQTTVQLGDGAKGYFQGNVSLPENYYFWPVGGWTGAARGVRASAPPCPRPCRRN